MFVVDLEKWQQTEEDLQVASIKSSHPRTRERYVALYVLKQQGKGATEIARKINRHEQMVIRWVNDYNEQGLQDLSSPACLYTFWKDHRGL